jgi:hypothetical protein
MPRTTSVESKWLGDVLGVGDIAGGSAAVPEAFARCD